MAKRIRDNPGLPGAKVGHDLLHHSRGGVMMRYFWSFCVLLAAGAFWAAPAGAATIFISGRVLMKDTNTPVGGATVSLYTQDGADTPVVTQSLMNGAFILKAPAAGQFSLSANCSGYLPLKRDLDVPQLGVASVDIYLERLPTLRLKLVGPDGAPVTTGFVDGWATFSVGHTGWMAPPVNQPATADGTLEIPSPAGIQTDEVSEVVVAVRDPAVGCGQIHLEDWPTEPVTLTLARGSTLNGKVKGENGKLLSGVTVTAMRIGRGGHFLTWRGQPRTTTDQDGTFSFPALFPATYLVSARYPDVGLRAKEITLNKATEEVTIGPRDMAQLGQFENFPDLGQEGVPVQPFGGNPFRAQPFQVQPFQAQPLPGAPFQVRPFQPLQDPFRQGPYFYIPRRTFPNQRNPYQPEPYRVPNHRFPQQIPFGKRR